MSVGPSRLTDNLRTALRTPGPLEEKARMVGRTYVEFAVEDAALHRDDAGHGDPVGDAVHQPNPGGETH